MIDLRRGDAAIENDDSRSTVRIIARDKRLYKEKRAAVLPSRVVEVRIGTALLKPR
jgi:hypothetical protein